MTARVKNRLIIIEDDEDIMKLLVAAFKAKGFDVHTFVTGKEGLAFLNDEKNIQNACLIILDRILPDMDGLDLLKEFVKRSNGKVPILILSMLSSEKDILNGLKQGAADYVPKPFSMPVLMEKARLLMEK